MTKIESGTATNVIPESAISSFDIRFTDKHTIEEIYAQFEKIISKYNGKILSSHSGAPIV
jgi:metal-dependent amidase/aminoacylase/carboxypeptidase family protein